MKLIVITTSEHDTERGQAMTEFVILLTVIMGICAGMLYVSRLLTFEFWAQQEARYLAFSQTWSQAASYVDPLSEPLDELNDNNRLRRPKSVRRLEVEKSVNAAGSLTGLLAAILPEKTAPTTSQSNVLVAWKGPEKDSSFSFVKTAYASMQENSLTNDPDESWPVQYIETPPVRHRELPSSTFEHGVVDLVHETDFGEEFCGLMRGLGRDYGDLTVTKDFSSQDCPTRYSTAFGVELSRSIDLRGTFEQFQLQLEHGFSPEVALESALSVEIATGFYSFFDKVVRAASLLAPVDVALDAIENDLAILRDKQSQRLLLEARYRGSQIAIGADGRRDSTIATGTYQSRPENRKSPRR